MYPERAPYDSGHFDVGDGHKLYYARYGNPKGQPLVYLHGGPGGGSSFEYRFFNPDHFNVLLFDQRGAGKSTPYAAVENNNITALIEDIEKLRVHFGIEKWDVGGGSWGSALGMLYALHHPERIGRMILRGIFFADSDNARYIIDEDGAAAKDRNKWFEDYFKHIPTDERSSGLTMPYYRRLISDDAAEAVEAARLFHVWDASIATMKPRQDLLDKINQNPQASLAISRIFFHYTVNEFSNTRKTFILEGLKNPSFHIDIVHGRQDWITPVENAIELHDACQNSRLHIVEDCGHSMHEPALQKAFVTVTDGWVKP